jgi:hypothetical protein
MTWEEFCEQALPEPHTITVEASRGEGPVGTIFDQAQPVTPCYVVDKRKQVRAPDGTLTISESQVFAPPTVVAPPGSRVTLPGGRRTVVISISVPSAAGLDLPEHAEIACE